MSSEQTVLRSIEKLGPDLVRLLQDLIRQRSVNPPGDVSGVAQVLRRERSTIGLHVSLYTSAPGIVNVQAVLKGTKEASILVERAH
jgi:acetylornithine deacetylase/succinyl-diaminopimelate desuccinylase-like protein